jgi:hypothetical protein
VRRVQENRHSVEVKEAAAAARAGRRGGGARTPAQLLSSSSTASASYTLSPELKSAARCQRVSCRAVRKEGGEGAGAGASGRTAD